MYVLQTEYFDIIYPRESTLSAKVLAEKSDDLYRAVCLKLETNIQIRMPVVITPDTDELNAYYTCVPYNRIVLYDTVPKDDSLLASYADTLISVFYHELVHAVSLNIKSPVMAALSIAAGDVLNAAQGIYLPTLFIEGVTVSFESADGYGRLNDSGSLHILQQAKSEGRFPSWQQVSGARDIYPKGTPAYIFGGAFAAYLQQKYGMSAYAKYWHECGKIQFFKLAPGIFKKVYGISLAHEWNNFRDSIPAALNANPKDMQGYESIQKRGLYKSLAACSKGIAWIENTTGRIRWLPEKSLNMSAAKRKIETLFHSDTGAEKLSFSADGAYLALTRIAVKNGIAKTEARVFDMKKRRFISKPLQGIRDACIVTLADGKVYLAGVSTFSQYSEIRLYRLNDIYAYGTKKIEPAFSKLFCYANVPYSLCGGTAGNLVYLEKCSDQWFFSLWNPADGSEHSWKMPCGKPSALQRIPNQRQNDFSVPAEFICEWHPALPASAEGNTGFLKEPIPVARSMRIMLNDIGTAFTCMISEQQNVFWGGFFSPMLIQNINAANNEAKDSTLFFISKKYEHDEINSLPLIAASYSPYRMLESRNVAECNTSAVPYNDRSSADTLIFSSKDCFIDAIHSPLENEKRFYSFLNMRKGILSPLPISKILGTNSRLMTNKLGLSYFTMDPTETWHVLSEFGFDINSGNCGALLQTGYSSPRLKQTARFAVDFDYNGAAVFEGLYYIQKTYPLLKNYSAISVRNDFSYTYGDISSYTSHYVHDGHELLNTIFVLFNNLRATGLGAYERLGFSVSAGMRMCLRFGSKTNCDYAMPWYVHPIFSASVTLPRLILFKNPKGKTVNLPLFASCSLFPPGTTANGENIFTEGKCTAVLFSQEIQRAVLLLYAHRLTFSVSYNWQMIPASGQIPYNSLQKMFAVPDEDLLLRQYMSLKIFADCSVIAGFLTGNIFKIGAEIQYHFRIEEKNNITYSIGFLTEL